MTARRGERGEGRVGCMLNLILLVAVVVAAVKVIPVYYNDDQLGEAAVDICGKGATLSAEAMEAALRTKAQALGIPEIEGKGALTVTVDGDAHGGTVAIHLKFTRKVDFFGAYTLPVEVDKRVMRSYVDSH